MEETDIIQQEQMNEISDLAAYDFVARKKGRREFLLNYFNSQDKLAPGYSSDEDFEALAGRATRD